MLPCVRPFPCGHARPRRPRFRIANRSRKSSCRSTHTWTLRAAAYCLRLSLASRLGAMRAGNMRSSKLPLAHGCTAGRNQTRWHKILVFWIASSKGSVYLIMTFWLLHLHPSLLFSSAFFPITLGPFCAFHAGPFSVLCDRNSTDEEHARWHRKWQPLVRSPFGDCSMSKAPPREHTAAHPPLRMYNPKFCAEDAGR